MPERSDRALQVQSYNFGFMRSYKRQIDRLGALAERYFRDDPNTCLIKLRQFSELLAQQIAARVGLYSTPDEPQVDLLRRLRLTLNRHRTSADTAPQPSSSSLCSSPRREHSRV